MYEEAKMMDPSASVTRKVAVDATLKAEVVIPVRMSISTLMFHSSNPIEMVGNPFGWWKQHGHHLGHRPRFFSSVMIRDIHSKFLSDYNCKRDVVSVVGQCWG
jgi:hypothetical protein